MRRLSAKTSMRFAIGPALLASTMLAGVPALAQGSGGIEEVVVTAQKRSEDLQKVPMQVQAITAQKLQDLHLKDFTDFALYMPNVTYAVSGQGSNGGPGFSNVTMRGIASDQNGNHSGPVPTVGVYFDEAPITTINGTLDIPAYDIARVEALSGPQGTLYGASAESGVIRIISNKPDTDGFAASYDVDVNSVAHGGIGYGAHGMVNVPLSDKVALRIVAWDEHDAGFIDNIHATRTYNFTDGTSMTIDNAGHTKNNYNTVDKLGGRAALEIDLDNNWTITPTLMGQTETSDGVFGFEKPNATASFGYNAPLTRDLAVRHFLPEYVHDKWYQAGLTVQGKIASLDLTYAGSYMDRKVNSSSDYSDYTFFYDVFYPSYVNFYDAAGHHVDPTQHILGDDHFTKESHELRLASSKDDRLRFQAGLFYEKQTHAIVQDYVVAGMVSGFQSPVTGWPNTLWLTDEYRVDKDYAAFGEVSFDILPSLTVTGGIRFYKFDNTLGGFYGFHSYEASRCFAPTTVDNGPCTDIASRAKGNGETHKINLTWNVTDDKLLYATYSTGFRPGGANRVFDLVTHQALPAYSPDTLDNYEIGWKSSWADNTVRFNGAFYYEKWNNFQFPFLGPNSVTIVGNVQNGAIVKGMEYDLTWLPMDNLTLSSSGAYNEADLNGPFCRDQTILCTNAIANAPDGTQLPITPKWKLNATARYEWHLDGDLMAHVQGSVVHSSGTWSDMRIFERSLLGHNSAYSMFDFTTGIDRDNWALELYVKNAFDERAQLGRYGECTPGTCGFEPYILTSQPRTVGITWSQKF